MLVLCAQDLEASSVRQRRLTEPSITPPFEPGPNRKDPTAEHCHSTLPLICLLALLADSAVPTCTVGCRNYYYSLLARPMVPTG